jgi:predicted dehydrogenase
MPDFSVVRWGILGPGTIANRFADGVMTLPDARLAAVGSRDQSRANAFADKYGIPNRHDIYESLVRDPEVDAVYVATPHNFHREHSLLALNAGKPVLCEKPFTINEREAREVVETARSKRLFLMEAMWTRCFPVMYRVRELLSQGAIGNPMIVYADFGFRGRFDPKGRLYNPDLGGGALLDVGVYTVSFASMVLGEPERITGLATLGETGVDEQAGMVFGYANGAQAVLSTSIRANTPHSAAIVGDEGTITIHPSWWKPDRLTISRSGQSDEEVHLPYESTGFNYEASEVARCLRAGKTESEIMPLDESLAIMRTMDTLRAQWGVKYPME